MNKLPPLNGKNALSLLAAGVMLAGLTACSSSSSDDNNGGGSTAQSVPVTGTAAKGILLGAYVEACVSTDCLDPIATATTSRDDGSYTLNIPANNAGTLVIRVSQQPGAKMICDVPAGCGNGVSFGQPADMESGLSLRSVTTVDASATTVEAHVSPLTELVTAAAIESRGGLGTLNADAVSKGSVAVRKLLGLGDGKDLTQIKPVDITKPEAANADTAALQLSLLAAAFADTNGTTNGTIKEKIESFTQAIATGSVDQKALEGLTSSATAALTKAATENTELAAKQQEVQTKLNEAKTKATEGCDENGCDIEIPAAEVDPSEQQQQLSINVKAVKALVADVRTLGWEIYPALRDATDENNTEKFVADNLIAEAENAGAIFDAGLSEVSDAISEIATLVSLAIESRNKLGDFAETSLNLQAIAEADYRRMNDWRLTTGSIYQEYCNDEWSTCDWALTPEQLDGLATTYAAQFSDTTISQSGTSWNVTDATYNDTSVNLTITFPNLSTGTNITLSKLDVTITGNATSQDGDTKLTLTEGALSITPSTPLPLKVQDGIWEYTGTGFVIADASLKASVTLENTDAQNVKRTFTGGFELAGGTSAAQRAKNPGNMAAFMPKKIALNGSFTASNVIGGKLEAKLTATMDNYDTYTSLVDGTAVNVPAAFTLSADAQTLSVRLGSGTAQQSFDVQHYVGVYVGEQYQTEDVCDYQGTEYQTCYQQTVYNNVCYNQGTEYEYCNYEPVVIAPARIKPANLAAEGEVVMSYFRMENCNVSDAPEYSMFNYHCGENAPYMQAWNDAPVTNILEALPVYELYWYLEDFRLQDATHGTVIFPDNWEDKYEQLSASDRTVTFNAVLDNAGYEDTEENHILATITAELTGKLSANLPEADVKLQLQRTGFKAGKADLTLGWTVNGSSRKFLQLSAQGAGNTDAELEQNLRVTLSDAAGTTVRLLLADDSTGTNVGYISKDDTRYATITHESNGYFVTYHFDDNGNPASEKSQAFESLF